MHGHNWKVEVYVRGEQLDEIGMLVDFKELKQPPPVMRYWIIRTSMSLSHSSRDEPFQRTPAGFILHKVSENSATPELEFTGSSLGDSFHVRDL